MFGALITSMKRRRLVFLLATLLQMMCSYAQEVIPPADGVVAVSDSLSAVVPTDSIAPDSTAISKGALDAPVIYQATDSIVMTGNNWAYLFGKGDVKYQNIQLQSEMIEMNMDSSLVFAKYGLDSVGAEFGYPLFSQGEQKYESKMMRYNIKSGKGYITDVITQQGEGYVTAGLTKKMSDDALNMLGGKYTTCDEHDHPHFYIQMTKAKVRPKRNIVTGPVYLVIEDVPLPLFLPFCFFPFSDTYSSGIIMPTFGDEFTRGYYLSEGGYYFAISDYMDMALTGELYTKGSWSLRARSSYRKRYKHSGSLELSYQVTRYGDKILGLAEGKTDDYQLTKDFKVLWTHQQDSKANPYRSFSASVNFATSSYDRNNMQGQFNGDMTQNTKSSSINITQRFPNSPFSLSATMNVNQTTRDSSISVTLPDVTATMSRIYPFKRKNAIGKERWYEKISMSYTGYLRNSIQTKENKLLNSNFIKDWKNSMEHTIPVQATFSLFNYLNISPSFNYKERWYTTSVEQTYDPYKSRIVPSDTTYGFYRIFDYSASVSASTTLYGFFQPLPFLGKKVEMIRHRMEPSISFSATPDFHSSTYGYWKTLDYVDSNGEWQSYSYSPFSQYGSIPGQSPGSSGSVNFSIDNNIEMKVRSDQDSIGTKKISLIDKLSANISYNLAADSFKWSNMGVNLRLKLSKSYTLNLSGTLDTYTYGAVRNARGEITGLRPVNVTRWQAGKGFGRLMNTGTSFTYTFNNDTFKNWFGGKDEGTTSDASSTATPPEGLEQQAMEGDTEQGLDTAAGGSGRLRGAKKDTGEFDEDGYTVNQVPWSLSFSYGLRLNYDRNKIDEKSLEYKYALTHSLTFNGSIQPSKNWNINFNATYDFDNHKLSYMTMGITRNLHCFQMSASIIPVGPYKSYNFSIAVSSSLLKDLKYDKRSNYRDGQKWY